MQTLKLASKIMGNVFYYSGETPGWAELEAVKKNRQRILVVIKARWASLALMAFYGVFLRVVYASQSDVRASQEQELMAIGALAFVATYNAWYHFSYRWWGRIRITNDLQLFFDLLVITYLIHLSGGVHSWFWGMYVLVTLEASYLLERKSEVWAIGACGGLLYGGLLTAEYYNIIPPVAMPFENASLQHDFTYEMITWGWVAVMNAAVALVGTFMMGMVGERLAELAQRGVRDELTGLYNRRYFYHRLQGEIERCRRYGRRFSLVMIDVDKFKNFNDRYGHVEGDHLLSALADVFTSTLRGSDAMPTYELDISCRYGGEEFAIILPETESETGVDVAERIRERVITKAAVAAAERIRTEVASMSIKGRSITISLGVSTYPVHGEDADALVRRADEALYEAKARGRNQVVLAPHDEKPETFL